MTALSPVKTGPRLGLLVLLLLLLGSTALAAETHVLGPEALSPLQTAVQSANLPDRARLQSLTVSGQQAEICFSRVGKTDVCALLVHPENAPNDALPAGPMRLIPGKNAVGGNDRTLFGKVAAIVESALPQDIWSTAKRKDTQIPPRIAPLLETATTLLNKEQHETARLILQAVERLAPELPEFQLLKARLAIQTGNTEDTAETLHVLESIPDMQDSVSFERARLALVNGDIEKSIDLLSARIDSKSPADTCKIERLARFLDDRNQQDKAAALRIAGIRHNLPFCADTWSNLSSYLLEHNRQEELMEVLAPALAAKPDNPILLDAKARVLRRNGQREQAFTILEKLYLDRPDPKRITLLSTLAARIGTEAMLAEMKSKMKANPDLLLYPHAVAVMSYYRGDYETTRRLMTELKPKLPNEPRVYIYGAMSRYELGDWDGARQWLAELESAGATNPDLYYCKAVLWHEKDPEAALGYLDQYLEKPPHPDEFKEKRAKAQDYREQLAAGEQIYDWIAKVDKPLIPERYLWRALIGTGLVVLLMIVVVLIRRLKRRN